MSDENAPLKVTPEDCRKACEAFAKLCEVLQPFDDAARRRILKAACILVGVETEELLR